MVYHYRPPGIFFNISPGRRDTLTMMNVYVVSLVRSLVCASVRPKWRNAYYYTTSNGRNLITRARLGGDGDLDFDTGLDVDDDLLDDLGRGVEAVEVCSISRGLLV